MRKPQRVSEVILAQKFTIKTLKLFSLEGRRGRGRYVDKALWRKALAFQPGLQPPEAGLPAEPSLAVPLPRFEFVPLAGSSLQSEVGGLSWQRASPPQLSDPTTHPPEPPPQTGL